MAVVNGWGNALLFVCSSKYVNECANDTNKGFYNSLLWSFNTGSLITGNIICAYVIPALSQAAYFEICLALNIMVCFYFLLITPPDPQPDPYSSDLDDTSFLQKSADDIKVEDVETITSRSTLPLAALSSDSFVSRQKLSIVGMNATVESASVISAS
jgi:hypothetical protein